MCFAPPGASFEFNTGSADSKTVIGATLSWVRIPPSSPCVMSQDIGITRTHNSGWVSRWWTGRSAGGLVRPRRVEGEGSEELASDCMDDPDVEVLDEEDDGGPGVGSADADVIETSSIAEGDLAFVADDVAEDSLVVVVLSAGGGSGLGQGVVNGGRGGAVGQGAVRALLVVEGAEEVEEGLELVEGGGLAGLGV